MSTLYIHIPFCNKKCPYCDFFSVAGLKNTIKDKYTQALLEELRVNKKYLKDGIKTLYFGGGSPVLIGIKNLSKIIKSIKPYLNYKTEITIEINPEHLEAQSSLKESLVELGFNRISIGVQTTKPQILKLIERKYKIQDLIENINWFKDNGVDISLDFMFALPKQNISDLNNDIKFIKMTNPEHVSFYMFTPPDRYKHKDLCPNEKLTEKMFYTVHQGMLKYGYTHYEVSNFAKKGKQSRHNSVYWRRQSYIGLGAGAHSFIKKGKTRKWNHPDINSYIKAPTGSFGFEILNKEQSRTEEIMLGLRLLNKGIKKDLLNKEKLKTLTEHKLLLVNKSRVTINVKSLSIMDEIVKELL